MWDKHVIKLPKDHGWEARPGNKIVVLDRGAVRFDIPESWVIQPQPQGSIRFLDQQPPDDNAALEVSYWRVPPIDWSNLPLVELLEKTAKAPGEEVLSQGEVVHTWSPFLEIAWLELRFLDPNEEREAVSRTGLARGRGIQVLFTFAFWPEDAPTCDRVWAEVFRTLQAGQVISDPIHPKGKKGKKGKRGCH